MKQRDMGNGLEELHEIIIMNSYGSGRVVYCTSKHKMLLSQIPSEGEFTMSEELQQYCAGYFRLYETKIKGKNK